MYDPWKSLQSCFRLQRSFSYDRETGGRQEGEGEAGAMSGIYISELLAREELKEVMENTGAGLELIGFSVAVNLDAFDRQLRRSREMLKALGCKQLTLHGPFLDLNPASYDRLVQEAVFRRFEEAFRAAELLGAEKIIFHSGRIPATVYLEGWAERTAEFFERFLEGRSGIQVLVENVFDPEYTGLLELAQRVRHPDFGLCLDMGHAHCFSPAPVTEWARALGPYVRHVHVHDNDGSGDQHLALGGGTIPAREVIGEILRQNPEVSWTVECSRKDQAEATVGTLKNCISQLSVLE